MPDWVIYTIGGLLLIVVAVLIYLVTTKRFRVKSIEVGFPPKMTLASGEEAGDGKDEIKASNQGKIGSVNIDGAAPSFSATADGGEIGDVTVKRKS